MARFKISKRSGFTIMLLLLVLILFFSFGIVLAESISGDSVVVGKDEVLGKTSFLSGNTVRIDGEVKATTFAAGRDVIINGVIHGDLFVAAQSITINGRVKGSLFTASNDVRVNGIVENGVYLAGARLIVNSQIEGSAFLAGQNVSIEENGEIGKDVFIGSSNVSHNGIISGDLFTSSGSLYINGKIGGDLNYRSRNQANFSQNSEVMGETNWEKVEPKPKTTKTIISIGVFMSLLWSILASIIIWLFIRWLRPNFWINLAEKISKSSLETLGFGALFLVITPLIILFLLFTLIGIPLSIMLLFGYIISIYISKIILSVFIGHWLGRRFNWTEINEFWPFLLALTLLAIVGKIPVIGWIFRLISIILGLGSIIVNLKRDNRAYIE